MTCAPSRTSWASTRWRSSVCPAAAPTRWDARRRCPIVSWRSGCWAAWRPRVGPDAISGGLMSLGSTVAPLLAVAGFPIRWAAVGFIRLLKPVAEPALYLYARVSPEGDRRLLVRPEFKAMFLDDLLNGSRKQLAAPFADVVVFARDWGFRLDQVKIPVRWWHGDRDHIVPFAHGQHVVSQAARCGAVHAARGEPSRRPRFRRGDSAHDGRALGQHRQEVISPVRTTPSRFDVINGASAWKAAAHQGSTQFVHRRAAGLDDGCLRLLPRRAGLRRHREDLPPHQKPKSRF